MLTLRPYQDEIVDRLRSSLRKGGHSPLVVAPTGSGKTVMFATIARGAAARNSRVLILVHRREILEQTLKSLYELGITSGQIASGRPQTTDPVQTAMVMSLTRRLQYVKRPDLIIVDECFPAGTEIAGAGKIERIKEGDSVLSYSEESKEIEHRTVLNVFRREYSGALILISANNKEIVCTPNHPLYTGHGWLEAGKIKKGMEVLIYETMQSLRKNIFTSMAKNLFGRMLPKRFIRTDGKNKSEICLRENEDKQSHEPGREQRKNEKYPEKNRPQAKDTRRKWKTISETCINPILKITGLWIQKGSSNFDENAKRQRISALLQGRFSKSKIKTRHRSRRKFSLSTGKASARQEERKSLNFQRVDNIKILECGSPEWLAAMHGNYYVYNLEIEGTHTYIANGIIVHNCHHALQSNSWGRTLQYWRDVPRIGFTATPERLDGRGLGETFDELILGPTVQELVDDGWLSYPVVYRPPEEVLQNYHVKRGDFDTKEQQQTMTSRKIVGDVIEHYRRHLDGLPVVCFCVSVEHSHLMAKQFKDAGYRAKAVWGNMPRLDRDRAIYGLADGSVQVVTSCDVISEGIDVPTMAGAILLRRTMSLAVYLQQAGRALRPAPGKNRAVILDHVGNYHLHGHVLDDRNWSLDSARRDPRKEKPPTTTTCPRCYGVWPGTPRSCPDCGFVFSDVQREFKPLKQVAGELIEAIPGLAPQQADSMAAFLARTQQMEKADKVKALWGKAYEMAGDGAPDARRRLDALRRALGYKAGFTRFVWTKIMGRRV